MNHYEDALIRLIDSGESIDDYVCRPDLHDVVLPEVRPARVRTDWR